MQISVRHTDRRVVQAGAGLGPLDGCDVVEVGPEIVTAIAAAKGTDFSFVNGALVAAPSAATALPLVPTQQQTDVQTVLDKAKADPAFAALTRIMGLM